MYVCSYGLNTHFPKIMVITVCMHVCAFDTVDMHREESDRRMFFHSLAKQTSEAYCAETGNVFAGGFPGWSGHRP